MAKSKKPTKKQIQIEQTIRNTIRFDKLCPACGGPLEIDRTNKCWKCDIKKATRVQLDIIEDATMSLSVELEIKHPPKPHNVKPQTPKRKVTKRKPTTRHKTTTKRKKPTSKRKK